MSERRRASDRLRGSLHARRRSGSASRAAHDGRVEVTVSDDGPGIPPELHGRIFEFDFSGKSSRLSIGFGLWWVKTLMARLGGSVGVESDGEHGTTFRLRLPCAEGEAP